MCFDCHNQDMHEKLVKHRHITNLKTHSALFQRKTFWNSRTASWNLMRHP